MGRPAVITFEDVARVCTRLLGSGSVPTNQMIYEELGRKGSMGTIQKHRTAFFAGLRDRGMEVLPATIPEDLVPLIEEWWTLSIHHAGKAYESERNAMLSEIEQHKQQVRSLNQDIVELGQQIDKLERSLDEARKELGDREQALASEQALTGQLHARVDEGLQNLAREREQYEARLSELQEDHRRTVGHYEDRIHTLKADLDASVSREKFEAERSERNSDYFLVQINAERERYAVMEESFRSVTTRLESELTIARTRENRLSTTIGSLEESVLDLEKQQQESQRTIAELTRSRDVLAAQMEGKDKTIASLQPRLQWPESGERDDPDPRS